MHEIGGWGTSPSETWGDTIGSWGIDIVLAHANILSVSALKPAIAIQAGGKMSLTALMPSATLRGSTPSTGVFSVSALLPSLNITGIHGRIGTMSVSGLVPTLSLTGFNSTSGTLSATALSWALELLGRTGAIPGAVTVDVYDCIVICPENIGNTVYTNFNFNSITQNQDTILVASSSGIYSLGGADDAGTNIEAVIELPEDDFNLSFLKTVQDIYLGYNGGPMTVEVVRDGISDSTRPIESTISNLRNRRVKLGKGNKNRYWGFKFKNSDGSDFDLDTIDLRVAVSKRRLVE